MNPGFTVSSAPKSASRLSESGMHTDGHGQYSSRANGNTDERIFLQNYNNARLQTIHKRTPHTHTYTHNVITHTLTLTQQHTDTPAVALWTSAVTHTVTPHSFVPPHTPQLSIGAAPQHTPEGDRGVAQHTPATSTATPLPPHTPHASSTPLQQRPEKDRTAPGPQHRPVVVSITPTQHAPAASATPTHPLTCVSSGMVQFAPSQPVTHTHCPDVVLHVLCAPQSPCEAHLHGMSVSHSCLSSGRAPSHCESLTTLPFQVVHVTLRVVMPRPQPEALSHPDQGVAVQVRMREGQRKRLQGANLAGLLSGHWLSSTMLWPRIHTGSGR